MKAQPTHAQHRHAKDGSAPRDCGQSVTTDFQQSVTQTKCDCGLQSISSNVQNFKRQKLKKSSKSAKHTSLHTCGMVADAQPSSSWLASYPVAACSTKNASNTLDRHCNLDLACDPLLNHLLGNWGNCLCSGRDFSNTCLHRCPKV
eukprot:354267-Chlamydomonas_euryale.AAC.4